MAKFHVTIDYRTCAGNPGSAALVVEASDFDEAYEAVRARIVGDKRRNVMKVDGGDTVLLK